jgi:hypothetical protein
MCVPEYNPKVPLFHTKIQSFFPVFSVSVPALFYHWTAVSSIDSMNVSEAARHSDLPGA